MYILARMLYYAGMRYLGRLNAVGVVNRDGCVHLLDIYTTGFRRTTNLSNHLSISLLNR